MWTNMNSSINVAKEEIFIRQASTWYYRLIFQCLGIYMELDMLSLISNGGQMNATLEASDSSSSIHSVFALKRAKVDPIVASTKFKGVLKQANGNWGAQLYGNHERFWLGTFKYEKQAAMAYDSAAMKLRSGYFHRNFPLTDATMKEQKFQSQFTTGHVLTMIKDGTYQAKFVEFLSTNSQNLYNEFDSTACQGLLFRKQLFQKELTPSDVGRLNRLVIPKKYALKYFPHVSESMVEELFDSELKLWNFRYCYWKSSQSFVFTKGWNRFVKEKQLKANDKIIFYGCEHRTEAKATRKFTMIDFEKGEENVGMIEEDPKQCDDDEMSLKLSLGEKPMQEVATSNGFKLFGVKIIVPEQQEGMQI